MTDPQDANASTRPISVAELLAKNGTIGAPPVGGRRRRRRGNSDSVTVAELTGEIPIYREDRAPVVDPPPAARVEPARVEPAVESVVEAPVVEAEAPVDARADSVTANSAEAAPATSDSQAEADYAAHLEQRDVEPNPIDFAPPPRRTRGSAPKSFSPFAKPAGSANTEKSSNPVASSSGSTASSGPTTSSGSNTSSGPTTSSNPIASTGFDSSAGGAEQMSPDPVADDDELVDLGPDVDFDEVLSEQVADDEQASREYELPSYLRSNSDTLFGGQSVADDLARRGLRPGPEDIVLDDGRAAVVASDGEGADDADQAVGTSSKGAELGGSAFLRGVWVVAQCILAVAFGAGLFIAFDQLWGWNTIVALVLSVLVILGLVVGVRVVRKTEDIGSTLIAVAVGALVTLGPLALLQSH